MLRKDVALSDTHEIYTELEVKLEEARRKWIASRYETKKELWTDAHIDDDQCATYINSFQLNAKIFEYVHHESIVTGDQSQLLLIEQMDTADDHKKNEENMVVSPISEPQQDEDIDMKDPLEKDDKLSVPMEEERWNDNDSSSDSSDDDGFVHVLSPIRKHFDMQLLATIVQTGEATLEAVRDKDCVLCIGNTGVGKSLFINLVAAGKEVVKLNHRNKQVFGVVDYVDGSEVKHGKDSATKQVSHHLNESTGLVFIDTAGFADTFGREYDTATLLTIKKVSQVCNSLRFVILISCVNFINDRAASFRDIANNVQKLIGDNFQDLKDCFCFLFTHVDEVPHIQEAEDQHKAILNELKDMKKATDIMPATKVLTEMLIRALKSKSQNRLFANIFHPVRSNHREILSNIKQLGCLAEQKYIKCHLPDGICRTILAEISKVSDDFQALVQEQIWEDGHITEFSHNYLAILCVESRLDDFRIKNSTESLKKSVADKIEMMRTSCINFIDVYLNEGQINRSDELVSLLCRCAALEKLNGMNEKSIFQIMNNRLALLIEWIYVAVEDKTISIQNISVTANVLKYWSRVDNIHIEVEGLQSVVQNTVDDAIARVVDSARDWRSLVASLITLDDIRKANVAAPQNNMHDLFADKSKQLLEAIQRTVNNALTVLYAAVHDNIFMSDAKDTFHEMYELYQIIGKINLNIIKPLLLSQLEACLDNMRNQIEIGCKNRLETIQAFLEGQNGPIIDKADGIRTIFNSLQMLVKSTAKVQGRPGLYSKLKDAASLIDLYVSRASKYLSVVSEQQSNTLQDPKSYLKAIETLEACAWLDDDFPEAETTYSVQLQEYKKFYADYAESMVLNLLKRLLIALNNTMWDREENDQFKRKHEELLNTKEYKICHTYTNEYLASARRLLDGWCDDRRKKFLKISFDMVLEKEWLCSISSTLTFCEGLLAIFDLDSACIRAFVEDIHDFLKHLRNDALEKLESKGNFVGKKAILVAAQTCCELNSSCLQQYLNLNEFTKIVTEQISQRSDKIQEEIKSSHLTADSKEIYSKISKLEEAGDLIDTFINGRAAENASRLKSMLTEKAASQDQRLSKLIDNCDWQNIGEYLARLKECNGQISREEYNKACALCCDKVREDLRAIKTKIKIAGTGSKVVSRLRALNSSSSSFRMALESFDVDLDSELKSLKQLIHHTICHRKKKLAEALDLCRYQTVIEQSSKLESDSMAINAVINLSEFEQIKSLCMRCHPQNLIEEVSATAAKFLEVINPFNSRSRLDLRSRSSISKDIEKQLNGLKEFIDNNYGGDDYALSEIYGCYQNVISLLSDESKKFRHELEVYIENERFIFAIKLLKKVKLELEPITPHLRVFDIAMEIKRIHDLELSHHRQKSYISESVIGKWLVALNKLKKSPGFGDRICNAFGWYDQRNEDYQQRINFIKGAMDELYFDFKRDLADENSSISSYSVRSKLRLLGMCKKLSPHIQCTDTIIRNAQNLLEERFTNSVKKIRQILSDGAVEQLREAFEQYSELACCVEENDAPRTLVHNALSSFVQKNLEQFNKYLLEYKYRDVKPIATKLLHVGYVLIAGFSLYNEILSLRTEDKTTEFAEFKRLVHNSFASSEITKIGKHYARLGLDRLATHHDVNRAYKFRIKAVHPDKIKGGSEADRLEMNELSKKVNESKEVLLLEENRVAFSGLQFQFKYLDPIKTIREDLQKKIRELLESGAYVEVKKMHVSVRENLGQIAALVHPPLNVPELQVNLTGKIKDHFKSLRIAINTYWRERKYVELQSSLSRLHQLEDLFIHDADIVNENETWKGIKSDIEAEIDKLAEVLKIFLKDHGEDKAFQEINDFALKLVRIGRILDGLPDFKSVVFLKMRNVLDACLEKSWGFPFLFRLGLILEQGENIDEVEGDANVAKSIVSEFPHFGEVRTFSWNEETVQKPVEQSIKEICGEIFISSRTTPDPGDKKMLLNYYQQYEECFNTFFNNFISPDADRKMLISKVMNCARDLQPSSIDKWDNSVINVLPFLLAGVFAYFTLCKSGESFNRLSEVNAKDDNSKVLMKAHPVQVLTILNILSRPQLPNHLMEVKTGEGKSFILGSCAAVLAILGFNVAVVCYSEYLSSRDNALFNEIFEDFGIRNYVSYSRITKMREAEVAKVANIREKTLELFKRSSNVSNSSQQTISPSHMVSNKGKDGTYSLSTAAETSMTDNDSEEASNSMSTTAVDCTVSSEISPAVTRKTIILADEVDVFFSSSYYGQSYTQLALIEDPLVSNLLRRIWMERTTTHLNLRRIQSWPEYAKLLSKYSTWRHIIDTEVRAMLADVFFFNDPPYVFDAKSCRIGYTTHDSVDYELSFGYRTTFAYLAESEKGHIGESTLLKVLSLRIIASQFSYANISPHRILGVSGTLSALSDYEKTIVLNAGISNYSFVPSVYGSSNFTFDRCGSGILVSKTMESQFQSVSQAIKECIDQGRAVIVFFESLERLQQFQGSAYGRNIRSKNILVETHSTEEKNYIVKRATVVGSVTLATSIFGRGTDFFSRDKNLEKNGGSHIIQTFLSLEKSEEIQIQGRTARQGKKGSFGMILLESDLIEKFGLEPDSLSKIAHADIYSHLDDLRIQVHASQLKEMDSNLLIANRRDEISQKYLRALAQNDHNAAIQGLHDIYAELPTYDGAGGAIDCHFLIDVSGSMGSILSNQRTQLRVAQDGINHIIQNLLDERRGDTFSLMCFSDQYHEICLRQSVENKAALVNRVDSLQIIGGTRLYTAFLHKLDQILGTINEIDCQQFLFVFTDGATSDSGLFGQLKMLIDKIPDTGLKCILAGVGLGPGIYRDQLEALATSGKMELIFFESTEQISDAFDVAAEAIVELTGGYIS